MESEKLFLLYFKFSLGKLDSDESFNAVMEFEDILREVVESEGLGSVDGHEFCFGENEESITYFIYTKNEKKLYQLVKPLIAYIPCLPGSCIIKGENVVTPIIK